MYHDTYHKKGVQDEENAFAPITGSQHHQHKQSQENDYFYRIFIQAVEIKNLLAKGHFAHRSTQTSDSGEVDLFAIRYKA